MLQFDFRMMFKESSPILSLAFLNPMSINSKCTSVYHLKRIEYSFTKQKPLEFEHNFQEDAVEDCYLSNCFHAIRITASDHDRQRLGRQFQPSDTDH